MTEVQTQRIAANADGISAAAGFLVAGGLVAFPTETVYGLGVRADDDAAVARLYEAKGRPSFNPLIVHVPDLQSAEKLAVFDADARRLADTFWPGALTLVLPLRDAAPISPLVTAGLSTVAIRLPDHPLAQAILRAANCPVAAPSANRSGEVSPTTADHVLSSLSGRIAAVVDGGPCTVGVESTIVATAERTALLRPGGLPAEAIEACLGSSLAQAAEDGGIQAPGQLASHYAPKGTVRLNVTDPQPTEVLLGFGPVDAALNLSPSGDLTEAAAGLFAALHELNTMGAERIAVSPIPETGLGRAINDRLRRAAAPRDT